MKKVANQNNYHSTLTTKFFTYNSNKIENYQVERKQKLFTASEEIATTESKTSKTRYNFITEMS